MAEEIEEIYNEMTAAASQESAMSGLDISGDTATNLKADIAANPSEVGRVRLIAWLVSRVMAMQRSLFRTHKNDVKALALNGHYGNIYWFVRKTLEFQYGDQHVLTDKDGYYSPVNLANRIVSHAAVIERPYKVIVLAVKHNGIPLNIDERQGLHDYFMEMRPIVDVEVRSAKADKVRTKIQVIADAKQGIPNIQSNVELAVQNYLMSLDIRGVVSRTKLKQKIMSLPGVIDVVIDELFIRHNPLNPWVNVRRIAYTFSGHAAIDPDYPLSSVITYTQSNV